MTTKFVYTWVDRDGGERSTPHRDKAMKAMKAGIHVTFKVIDQHQRDGTYRPAS